MFFALLFPSLPVRLENLLPHGVNSLYVGEFVMRRKGRSKAG
jgi:hypothetical protein